MKENYNVKRRKINLHNITTLHSFSTILTRINFKTVS